MLILTRESDQTLKLRLADDVDPNLPVGEVFGDGDIVLEETQAASVTTPSAPTLATTECENTNKELAEAALDEGAGEIDTVANEGQETPTNVQFSLPTPACQRIRQTDQPRRVLGPAAADLNSKTEQA